MLVLEKRIFYFLRLSAVNRACRVFSFACSSLISLIICCFSASAFTALTAAAFVALEDEVDDVAVELEEDVVEEFVVVEEALDSEVVDAAAGAVVLLPTFEVPVCTTNKGC